MDFALTEDQSAVKELARRVFGDHGAIEAVAAAEAAGWRHDTLWKTLAGSELLGIALPMEDGGAGMGLIGACLLLEQQGRTVVPLPLLASTVLGGMTLSRFASDGLKARWLPALCAGEAVVHHLPSRAGHAPAA